jgi:hypothetical protein
LYDTILGSPFGRLLAGISEPQLGGIGGEYRMKEGARE